jgi:hypothetical protein
MIPGRNAAIKVVPATRGRISVGGRMSGMIVANCPRHGRRVLLGNEAIERIDNGADGMTLHLRCTCGARWTERTGRRRATAIA